MKALAAYFSAESGRTAKKLKPYVKGADILDARLMNGAGADTMKTWVAEL